MNEMRERPLIRMLDMVDALHRGPCSLQNLTRALSVSKRTVYRYLNALETSGRHVGRDTQGHYYFTDPSTLRPLELRATYLEALRAAIASGCRRKPSWMAGLQQLEARLTVLQALQGKRESSGGV